MSRVTWLRNLVASWAILLLATVSAAEAKTLGRHGAGWLEEIDGYLVLHLEGTHREMGVQHGKLLGDHIRQNVEFLVHEKGEEAVAEIGPVAIKPNAVISQIVAIQRKHVPQKYWEEIEGLAEGSGLSVEDVQAANFIPELFHCSGFALMNSATKDGTLYHGRVLDYGVDMKLQDHAVLIVAKPKGGIPFVNVSYAGFVGSVTGMNNNHVSIGEMGGKGLGQWNGVPMAFLVREVLESAGDLDEAVAVFRDSPRTCEYYFVIADGKTNRAVGMEAGASKFSLVQPNTSHPLLPRPVKDAVLLSAGERYNHLVDGAEAKWGQFTAEDAIRLMDRPVAMKSNLHNALFEPRSTKFWVANANAKGEPAADQKYYAFQLSELLERKP